MFSSWDANLYSEVIHSCDLGQDLLSFPKGDRTAVGSKGYALSGGQRQRLVSSYNQSKVLNLTSS